MKTLRITPKRLDIERLSENDQWLTNGYWMIDKTRVDMHLPIIENIYVAFMKSDSPYKNTPDVTQEACSKVLTRAMEGELEILQEDTTSDTLINNDSQLIGIDTPNTRFLNKQGKATVLNPYYLAFFKKLGATYFSQTQTYKYGAIIAYKPNGEIVGLIMPIKID